MIQVSCKQLVAALVAGLFAIAPIAAPAAYMADPVALYQKMKDAYAQGAAAGWDFRSELVYFSTIVDAGRAYSLQYPDDPNYALLAGLTVQIGTGTHYNPLTNHDAASWWVREASNYVIEHAQDPNAVSQARVLVDRVNAEEEDPNLLAQYADEDATATLKTYPGQVDALLIQVEADWRGWLLTRDAKYRSLALARAAAPNFPVAHLPTDWGNELVNLADGASTDRGFTAADVKNAQIFLARLRAVDPIRVITTVNAVPHDVYLTTLAPADEYFGHMGMSILEIENRLKHINFMLDYKYGNLESSETVNVADSLVSMQEVYPRDKDLPMLLYWTYTTLHRMTDAAAMRTAKKIKGILTVEYQDSPQARKLLPE
jgi:hypothetical protein